MKNIYLGKKGTSAVNFIRRVIETVQPVKTIKKYILMYSEDIISRVGEWLQFKPTMWLKLNSA